MSANLVQRHSSKLGLFVHHNWLVVLLEGEFRSNLPLVLLMFLVLPDIFQTEDLNNLENLGEVGFGKWSVACAIDSATPGYFCLP
jgi:hypothetical protein